MTSVETFVQGMHGEFLPKYDWPVHRFQNMEPLPCLLKLYHSVQMQHLLSCLFWDSIFSHSATCFTTCSLYSSLQCKTPRLCQVLSGLDGDTLSQDRSNAEETAASSNLLNLKISHAFSLLCNFTSDNQAEFMPKLGNAFEQKACTTSTISDCKTATNF